MGSLFGCCFAAPPPEALAGSAGTGEKDRQKQSQGKGKPAPGRHQPQPAPLGRAQSTKRQDSLKGATPPAAPQAESTPQEPQPARRFRYKDLEIATANFSEELVLGEGGFGKVYQGRVEGVRSEAGGATGGMNVAIKKLNPESIQGYEQWVNEVLLLDRLHHPNLVRLLGYCAEDNEALLVYTLYPRGSLDKVLFEDAAGGAAAPAGPGPPGAAAPWQGPVTGAAVPQAEHLGGSVLTWQQRVRVALDAARGLAYLHSSSVIHRDFKPSNILLSGLPSTPERPESEPAAVLTDFGMARVGPNEADTHISTRIMGTLGYLDPLYLETGRLTYKSDTFAYGVMLLELLTGQREGTERRLSSWVRAWELDPASDDIVLHVDWRLRGQYPRSEARRLALLASKCLSIDQEDRPEMAAVVEELTSLIT